MCPFYSLEYFYGTKFSVIFLEHNFLRVVWPYMPSSLPKSSKFNSIMVFPVLVIASIGAPLAKLGTNKLIAVVLYYSYCYKSMPENG